MMKRDIYSIEKNRLSTLTNAFRVNQKISALIRVNLWLIFFCLSANAQTLAPGAPGKDAQWASAGKQGVGTSASPESKVWFTLQGGALTEVYYPDVTVANVHILQFIVVNPKTKKVETERDDTIHQIKVTRPDSLTFQQINTAKSGEWKITKTYTTDVERDSVLIEVEFDSDNTDLIIFLYYDPSLNNSGMHDTSWTKSDALLAQDKEISSAIVTNPSTFFEGRIKEMDKSGKPLPEEPYNDTSNGFYGVSDGLTELIKNVSKPYGSYVRAENGNVVQIAPIQRQIKNEPNNSSGKGFKIQNIQVIQKKTNFTVSLGFGKSPDQALDNARNSLKKGFQTTLAEYEKGWSNYVKTLRRVEPKYQAQFNMAAMVLKAHEDKTHPGANIASLSVPWGGGDNANENTVAGYHLVWSRDLYQVATAFMALGDTAAANRALDFVFKVQQKPDGSFPQNSFLDGKPFWGSLQHDEVAFPLILAYQLNRFDRKTYENHVKKAADFIVRTGPKTPQERWEEEGGYSPSTIAAEIAGLVCAAEIAKRNGDEASATIYLATADDWARNVERWTATTTGKYGDGNYYLRITQNGNPDKGEKIELNNGAGFFDEREIVDAGFLELVRLGIKSPDDPLIAKSVKVIDQIIKINTPNGEGFYRYNHDGYGEMDDGRRWNWDGKYTGKGRLWALLSGERGQYELALSNLGKSKVNSINPNESQIKAKEQYDWKVIEVMQRNEARVRLDAMLGFANDGLMIPEQVWDKPQAPTADSQFSPNLKFGEGTGSATPLAWSMAQFIRLAVNLQAGKNLETPDIVYERYAKNGIPRQASNFGGTDQEAILPVKAGEKFSLTRRAVLNAKVASSFNNETRLLPVNEKGEFTIEIVAPEKEEIGIVAVSLPNGATAFERVKVRSSDKLEAQKLSGEIIEKIKTANASPIIENGRAIVFYRGAAKNVQVAGDMTSWSGGRIFMQNVGENLFAAALDLVPTTRAEYKLIVDGQWIIDPLNPNKLNNGVGGENSVLTMPDYKPTVWSSLLKSKSTPGIPDNIPRFTPPVEIESKIYGKVKVGVYVPRLNTNERLPVLYLQDGNDYLNRAGAIEIQDNLVKAGKIKPFIMVFLNPKDRTKEYWASDDYARFLATEVVSTIDEQYNTIKNRDGRAVLGASLGGITSVWVGLKYPEVFARIGGQSSSFWVDDERVAYELSKLDAAKTKLAFYFDDGALEGADDTRRVVVMLRGKGFPVVYAEGETGHSWTSWRDRLAEAFVALWK